MNGLVAGLLQKHAGKYVDGLDSISVGLGTTELKNLVRNR